MINEMRAATLAFHDFRRAVAGANRSFREFSMVFGHLYQAERSGLSPEVWYLIGTLRLLKRGYKFRHLEREAA